jgi:hypothetical protein
MTGHSAAWGPVFGVVASPTTCPPALTARATLELPPRVPRSIIPPAAVHENAWSLTGCSSCQVQVSPTTGPLAFSALAELEGLQPQQIPVTRPLRAPRSIIPSFAVQENARWSLAPTTCPLAFTAEAQLQLPSNAPSGKPTERTSDGL